MSKPPWLNSQVWNRCDGASMPGLVNSHSSSVTEADRPAQESGST
jgi:hypothetical protein